MSKRIRGSRDLYYRLNVLHIEVPPLRRRRDDIPVLLRQFVSEFSRAHDQEFRGLAPEALEILLAYDWPGNVRELRNLVESMVVLAPGAVIRPEDIPAEIRSGRGTSLLPVTEVVGPLVESGIGGVSSAPQLEFVFRTLVALKVDVEDLKREFEAYKMRVRQLPPAADGGWSLADFELGDSGVTVIDAPEGVFDDRLPSGGGGTPVDESPSGEVAFHSGMTMAELEREAIIATLGEVGGNRRKAAEQLQIGERTLYRKIKQYEIDL